MREIEMVVSEDDETDTNSWHVWLARIVQQSYTQ